MYEGPGNIGELNQELIAAWQARLSEIFENGIQAAKNEASPPHPKAWLFNPIKGGTSSAATADIKWPAFPKRLQDTFGSKVQAWREGDRTRDRQEEYCEWEVVRDPNSKKLLRVTFSTEVPEYYEFLYKNDPGEMVKRMESRAMA